MVQMNLFTKQNWSQKTDIENKVRGKRGGLGESGQKLGQSGPGNGRCLWGRSQICVLLFF